MKSSIPRMSVIIPAYNSHKMIAECLEALQAQTFKDFEIIVINSSPEQLTGSIVQEKFPEVIFEQSPCRLLPHAARNRGVELSRGAILVFTDPDCVAVPEWLEHLAAAHDTGHSIAGGAMDLVKQSGFEWAVHLSKFSWLLSKRSAGTCRIICTANASYERTVFNRVGPFDGSIFTGDAILSLKAQRMGFSLWFEPKAVVLHQHGGRFIKYIEEFYIRGREFAGARAELEQWSESRVLSQVLLMPFVYLREMLRIGLAALSGEWGWRFLVSLPVVAAYKMAWILGEGSKLITWINTER